MFSLNGVAEAVAGAAAVSRAAGAAAAFPEEDFPAAGCLGLVRRASVGRLHPPLGSDPVLAVAAIARGIFRFPAAVDRNLAADHLAAGRVLEIYPAARRGRASATVLVLALVPPIGRRWGDGQPTGPRNCPGWAIVPELESGLESAKGIGRS